MQGEQNSVMAVFSAVAAGGELSRAQISDITGFSLMTVGKAVELLEYCGVFTQRKQSSGSAGRRMSLYSVNSGCGMIVYDLSSDKWRVRILDLAFGVCGEFAAETADIGELTVDGFGCFMEVLGGELAGIACVVPDGMREEYSKRFFGALGHMPDIIIEKTRAYGAANAVRLDSHGAALFLVLGRDGTVTGSITCRGRLYTGAHGNAGRFSAVIGSRAELAKKLCGLIMIIDPEAVHIACENEAECGDVMGELTDRLGESGVCGESMPQIIVEPAELCRSASDGAALMLREKYILSKIPNNT